MVNQEAPIINCEGLSERSGIEDVAKLVLLMPRRSLGVGITMFRYVLMSALGKGKTHLNLINILRYTKIT